MAINIIERAVVPYNSPTNKIVNKEQYSLFAPAAGINKPGMAGFSPDFFSVRNQIVELNPAFLGTILHRGNTDESFDPDGIKEPGAIYSNFTHEVIDRRVGAGTAEKITVTGTLMVASSGDCITEILFAEGRIWTRMLYVTDDAVVSITEFEPPFDGLITNARLAQNAVDSQNLANDSVVGNKIVNGAISSRKLADGAVITSKIGTAAVTADKLGDKAVTSAKIADMAIENRSLNINSVAGYNIQDGTVDTSELADDAVTAVKLASNAVTTAKVKDGSITTEKLYTGSVTETKLSAGVRERLLNAERGAWTDISYNQSNGVITFVNAAGEKIELDLPYELTVSGGRYDPALGIVLVLANGDEIVIPVEDFVKDVIAEIEEFVDDVYSVQKAPPISALANAILLTTPTLAIVAGLTR